MEDMIDKLYNLHLNTNSFPLGVPDKEALDEEWKLYDFLYESLPDEYKKAFLRYIELRGIRQSEELRNVYSYGFKGAVKLILESMKE